MDECCVVCADPLEWTGCGPCGHIQTCSKCVARLRFVLKDKRCVICQQESETAFFTRYMGNYTRKLTTEQFHALSGGAEFRCLSIINGYFDDPSHFETIKALCSYTHPEVDPRDFPTRFPNLKTLKMQIKEQLGKQFCDICLTGRNVFVCEQLLYTPQEAKMHMQKGDLHGPLAEAGFKGHPICEFCRSRFYSETELRKHNKERHEVCFICREEHPEIYRYYRNYADLEDHFKRNHCLCPHPACLEERFNVFRTESELKQHFAEVHERREGNQRQRRETHMVETNFQYRRPARGRGRGRFQLNSRQEYAPARSEDVAPLHDPNGFHEHRLVQLTDEDFPSFVDTPQAAQSSWPVRGHRSGSQLRDQHFPSLPGQPVQKRRPEVRSGGGTMAARVAGKTAAPSRHQPMPNPNLQVMRNVASSPQLHQESSAGRGSSSAPSWPVNRPRRELTPEPQPATSWVTLSKGKTLGSEKTETVVDDFPSLLGGGVAPGANRPKWGRPQEKPRPPEPPTKPKAPTISDASAFPSLGGSSRAATASQRDALGPMTPVVKVSEGLKTANKVLIKKLKDQMDTATFHEFHQDAEIFLKDSMEAEIFHQRLVERGLAHYIAEVASLCPIPTKGKELLTIHSAFIEQCKQDPDNAPVTVPLTVVEQSYQRVMTHPVWSCVRCSTLNLAEADFCEACDMGRSEGLLAAAAARPDPTPFVYRRTPAHPRTLFGVDDRKKQPNVWAKRPG